MYPLKFKRHLVEKVWGGRSFEKVLGIPLPQDKNIGESWEVSSHGNGMSVVAEGKYKGETLEELVKKYKEKLVGENVYKNFGEKFPLLIKYLDVNDRLSVQVHPNDAYALKKEGEFGKSECWYIIEASSDAKLILGIKKGIEKDEFIKKSKNSDFENLFNEVPVKKGDFINITPGLVHASLSGSVLLCEIQQSSDTTYRIYDFDRVVNGKKRELHLEKAYEVIAFDKKPEITGYNERKRKDIICGIEEELVKCKYFNVNRIKINGKYTDSICPDFKIYSFIDGEGSICYQNNTYTVRKGDTYLIPANLEIEINGKLEFLKSWI